jgi:hypothetical protein
MAGEVLPRVHVTFGTSAAGGLKFALEALGRQEKVIYLLDDLSLGPIRSANAHQRIEWAIEELGFEEEWGIEEHTVAFWEQLATGGVELFVWISRRCVVEYCGFLELLWRVKDVPVSLIDVADVEFHRNGSLEPHQSQAFASVLSAQIVEKHLYERAVRVTADDRVRYESEWRRLRDENGECRVLTEEGLVSAPITYYDDALLSHVTHEWQRFLRVVTKTMGALSQGPYRQCTYDVMLTDRLIKLIEDGRLEGEMNDEVWSFRDSRVRRR